MDAHHLGNATVCEDVAGMNEPIEHLSCLFNQVALVRIILKLLVYKRTERKATIKTKKYQKALLECHKVSDEKGKKGLQS